MNEITPSPPGSPSGARSQRPARRVTIDLPLAMAERIEATWPERARTKAERYRALLAKGLEAEGQS
jgi:hypothetical protein